MRSEVAAGLGALALWLACADEFRLDETGGAEAGRGGAGGVGGMSGVGGMGGAGQGGGAGSGGSDNACDGDGDCATAGSLCVATKCTAPTGACTTAALVVVPDPAFAGAIAGDLAGACHYRALGEALAAAASNGSATTGVVVYAASVEGPAQVPGGVRLEGRPTAPAQLVALTAGVGSGAAGAGGGVGSAGAGGGGAAPPLVALGDKAALAGFALDAGGAVGVRVASGKASLEGPLELRGGAPALAVENSASAIVTGTAAAKVLFVNNARGIAVAETAGLTMTGEGGTGLVIEKTSLGAALLVDKGGFTPPVEVKSVVFRGSTSGGGPDGAGAVEVRPGRQVLIEACTFEKNQQSVTLNAQDTNNTNIFLGVNISGNDFKNALPAPGQGAAVCGSKFVTAGTEINLEPLDNIFPTAATCAGVTAAEGCIAGVDVGYDAPNTAPTLDCP